MCVEVEDIDTSLVDELRSDDRDDVVRRKSDKPSYKLIQENYNGRPECWHIP